MKAITTKYFGPGNVRGSRMKATAEGGNSITVQYDDGLNLDRNHAQAARALCQKMNWTGEMLGGHLSEGMVWVFVKHAEKINTP